MEIELQDEIDRKALEALDLVNNLIADTGISREHLNEMLHILQTSFNGIVSRHIEYGSLLTEASEIMKARLDWDLKYRRVYRHETHGLFCVSVSGSTLKMAGVNNKTPYDYEKTYSLPSEAFRRADKAHDYLIGWGFKLGAKRD